MECPNTDTSNKVTPNNCQPRSCAVWGNSLAPFGFGLPLTRGFGCLTIGNAEYITDNLAALESRLCDFAIAEGISL